MATEVEQRKYPRMSTSGGAYGVRFRIGELDILDARLGNLSAGGCGLEIQIAEAAFLEVGDLIEALFLDHPDLPFVPLSATVLRLLGKVPGKTNGYVLAGVEFQDITPFIRDVIAGHVASRLAPE
jgi:c-di-GMP-binding flagellar brake protein YcgR